MASALRSVGLPEPFEGLALNATVDAMQRRLMDRPALASAGGHLLGTRDVAGQGATLPGDRLEPQLHPLRPYELVRAGGRRRLGRTPRLGEQLLQREAQLLEMVQRVGADTLGPSEYVLLRTGRLLREDFLQQSAFDDRDAYCDPPKQVAMFRAIRAADSAMRAAVDRGVPVADAAATPSATALARTRFWAAAQAEQRATTLVQRLETELGNLTSDNAAVHHRAPHRDLRLGPLLVADHGEQVAYDELVDVVTPTGELRRGHFLGGTRGLDVTSTTLRVRVRSAQLSVGRDLVGRVLDGMGRPIDGGTPVLPVAQRDLNGHPVNPVARAYPAEFIETGVSAIDGLHTLVRDQKLPVFSGYGLPGLELATRIAHAARVRDSDDGFIVVFAAIGVTEREAAFVRTRFAEGAALLVGRRGSDVTKPV